MADIYCSVTGAGAKTGESAANAFEGITDAMLEALSPGDTCYLESGEYNASLDIAKDGTIDNLISLIGVSSLSTLAPATGTDRPYFNQSDNYRFMFDNYWKIANIRILQNNTTINGSARVDTGGILDNIKVEVTGTGTYAFYSEGTVLKVINCEASIPNGIGFHVKNSDYYFGCYAHDCVKGFNCASAGFNIDYCIADSCDVGFSFDSGTAIIKNSVLYNCGKGIFIPTTKYNIVIFNCIISECTIGIESEDATLSNYIRNNCYYNNTTDVDGVPLGDNAVEADPKFTDPSNGDFSLQSSSPCIDAGMKMILGVGL